ncbi:unnamed protein product [Agarophyton chilense]
MMFTSLVFFALIIISVSGQECLFNETMCSCSFGSTQGSCYERIGAASDGTDLCSKRACDAGWTCDCVGDFFCTQANVNVFTLIDLNDFELTSSVPCELTPQRTITSAGFQLGFFHPQFSNIGLLAQDCQVFAWWLDGVLQNNFAEPTTVTGANLQTVRDSLSDWNNLPLRRGSVIGFRWRNAPYSCYNSISQLSVNGTELDTTDTSAVTHRFSNNFEDDWFSPDFVEGSNWRSPATTNFADTFGVLNTEFTNTYWRIKVL